MTDHFSWTKLLGTSGSDLANALTIGSDGAIYVSGYTQGSLDGQTYSGGLDAFITKYLPDGTKAWTRLLGTSGTDEAYALTTGSDGAIYVSGYTQGSLDGQTNSGGLDAFITKYLPDSTKAWTKLLGTSSLDRSLALTTGSDGATYVSGYTYGNLDGQSNNGTADAFITKYLSNGTKAWTRLLGTSAVDAAYALTTGNDGTIYTSGFTRGNLNGQNNNGGNDAFITKYQPDGNIAWTRLLGTLNEDHATGLTTGIDEAIYVSGYTQGSLDGQINSGYWDAFITKYLPDGTKVWTRLLGTAVNDFAYALTTGSDGAIYVSGETSGNLDGQANSGGDDAFIAKFLPDGTKVWTKLLGSSGLDASHALATGGDGAIYIGGDTSGNLEGQINSGGETDAFITKLIVDGGNITSLAVTPTNANQTEGNSGTKAFTFTVTRSGNTTGTNAVNWAVTGTGINPANAADFGGTLPSGIVTFATNETAKVITINVSGDTTVESQETFIVTLSNPSNGTISTVTATGTIQNDDIANQAPTNVTLSNNSIAENKTIGTVIGNFSTTDPDVSNTFTYNLVAGTGSTNNNLFTIQSNQLKTNAIFDYETQNSYSIRVKTTDQGGLSSEKQFTISITDINEVNQIIGDDDDNNLIGTEEDDNIEGQNGNDTLNGGAGNDTLIGGLGNDTYIIDMTGDVIIENLNGGTDTVRSSISYTLGANLENLLLMGTSAINGTGNSLRNTLTGNNSHNILKGDADNDTLKGKNGNDFLMGGVGNDTLTGGKGSDYFTFNSFNEGIDRITDFNVIHDTIAVSAEGFDDDDDSLEAGAAITPAQFYIGTSAITDSQLFIYNAATGRLFFDADGNGTTAPVQLATLNTGLALTHTDILVLA